MRIDKNKVVGFHYRLSDGQGQLLEDSYSAEPVIYLHGRHGIIGGLELAMAGKVAGDRFSVTVTPEQGYGERREDAQQRVPIKHLSGKSKKLRVGQVVSVSTDQGARQATVTKVGRFSVDLDTNHPLAGKTLTFDVEVISVRDASEEESAHGHAHGPGGHAH